MSRLVRIGGHRLFLCLLAVYAAACGQVATPTSPPPLQTVTVAYPSSLKPAEDALNSCAQVSNGIALLVSEIPSHELIETSADLLLWFGEPPENAAFAAPLATEEILIIVHPENPARIIPLEEISAILRGEIGNWEQLVEMEEPVVVWMYPPGNEIQLVIGDELIAGASISSSAYLAPDPAAMIDAVSNDKGAIGLLPRAWMVEEVSTLRLEGGEGVDLRRPVLVLSRKTPAGAVRNFLACLQSQTGQNVLERRYESWIE